MPTIELESKAPAPREPSHVGSPQPERVDEPGKAVGPVGEAKRLHWIR